MPSDDPLDQLCPLHCPFVKLSVGRSAVSGLARHARLNCASSPRVKPLGTENLV